MDETYKPNFDGAGKRIASKAPLYLALGLGAMLLLAGLWLSLMIILVTGDAESRLHVSFPLPERAGEIRYAVSIGRRLTLARSNDSRITLRTGTKNLKWRLPESGTPPIRVYWYHSRVGGGPILKFVASDNVSVLDLAEEKVGMLFTEGKRSLVAYYLERADGWSSPVQGWDFERHSRIIESAGGGDPKDVSGLLTSKNEKYLGSVICKDRELIFVPSDKAR